MNKIRKMISAWMLILAGTLLVPFVSIAATSGATHDTPYTTTTAPATITEHSTAIDNVAHRASGLRVMASGQVRSLLGFSRNCLAAKTPLKYHYTTADESLFANGLREGSSVTDKLYSNPLQASQELGIPVPNKVIPIQDAGQFVPAKPSVVQGSNRYLGGGNDFNNLQPVPPSQLLPAQPIGPR